MEIVNLTLNSVPLSTSYESDDDLTFKGHKASFEEGYSFFEEEYLKVPSDNRINNYSSLYLTNKKKITDFLEFKMLNSDFSAKTFNSSLIDSNNGLYLTLSSPNGYSFTEKNQRFVDKTDRIFEVTLLDSTSAKILHRNKNRQMFYLSYLNTSNTFNFLSTDNNQNTVFEYILDRTNNKLALFKTLNGVKRLIFVNNNTLSSTSVLSTYITNNFNVNYYIQQIKPKLNTSWVSYNNKNKNVYQIVPENSRLDLENNYIVSTQYSYVTGDVLKSNILTLKNQYTNKNYSNRSDFLEKRSDNIPNVDNRRYFGLFSGNEQEGGDYNLTLSYEFYNTDYKFEGDKYNPFTTPESLYPYEQININDLDWNKKGAIAGQNPYLADKVFQKKLKNGSYNEEYLCTWLFEDQKTNKFVWLDRYYVPEKTNFAAALSTTFNFTYLDPQNTLINTPLKPEEYYDVPHVYNTLEDEFKHTPQTIRSALYGHGFYDKMSDVTILPNSEYIYHRLGNNYIKQVIKNIEDVLIQNGLSLKNSNDTVISLTASDVDDIEYVLDGNSYASIDDYNSINEMHQFTICLSIKSDDWVSRFGHQIFGNLNNKGLALLDDQKITPFITVQKENKLHIYNTDFTEIDVASLENEEELSKTSKIKDIFRCDHLDSFYTIIQ